MERVIVFLAQTVITVVALILWLESAGDGPGAPIWFAIETFPVFLWTFIAFAVSLIIRRKTNLVQMSATIIGIYFAFRCLGAAYLGEVPALVPFHLLHPILPEALCLLYYRHKAKKDIVT